MLNRRKLKGLIDELRVLTAATLAVVVSVILSGCVSLGWRFGPGFSSRDTALFSESPVVVHRGEEYFLAWTQGSSPFFFQPDYKAMNGRLVFALVATASSGSLAGRHREMKVDGAGNVVALRDGGACWWERDPEPNGACVRLRLVEQTQDMKQAGHQ